MENTSAWINDLCNRVYPLGAIRATQSFAKTNYLKMNVLQIEQCILLWQLGEINKPDDAFSERYK